MQPRLSSRLLALAAAAVLAAGCAAAPSTVARTVPAAAPPTAPAAARVVPTETVVPAYPRPAIAAPPQAAYPVPQPTPAAAPPPAAAQAAAPPPTLQYRVVGSYPHDPTAFTQGLVYIGDDTLYEGTGLVGRSTLREVHLDGTIRRSLPIDPSHFGEGVAVVGNRVFQLTWQNCVGYLYEHPSLTPLGQFRMPIDPQNGRCLEGWGLTTDGSRLILSDGSSRLFFVDPAATERSGQLAIVGQVNVSDNLGPIVNLNELEYIDGQVFANLWLSERIARIDPATGAVTAYLDLSGLRPLLTADPNLPPPEVLNGIAYDAAGDRLFVTGKLWPTIFEIDLLAPVVYLSLLERG